MNKEDILKILEGAKDKNGDVPMRLVRQAFEKLPELCADTISRQTAIDALEKVAALFPWKVPGNRDSYDRYNEAWNDAIGRAEIEIEELPSVQTKPCEDAVSRQRLLNDLKELKIAWEKYPVMAEQIKGVETAIEYVEAIPSVTPKPEPCEDAVSREAAVNAIKKEIEMNNEVLRSSTITYETRECISQRNGQAREDIAAIEVLPSVTPKRKE